uniref:NADH dehydrogenase subunit 6 n=1 Tax=Bragasellus molinai TaxID=1281925 RepID=A0A485M8X6_9CRUS|nr:NADH dehydrogenase subunit 6 [Bragasellus molinai]
MNFLLFSLIMLSLIFILGKVPHILMFSILLSTLLTSILVGIMKMFPWSAYILFLVFLGGILILFTYVSSLSSNFLFTKLNKTQILFFSVFMSIGLILSFNMENNISVVSLNSLNNMDFLVKELFTPMAIFLYFYMFIYLLMTLIYVIFLMKTYYAPLRFFS